MITVRPPGQLPVLPSDRAWAILASTYHLIPSLLSPSQTSPRLLLWSFCGASSQHLHFFSRPGTSLKITSDATARNDILNPSSTYIQHHRSSSLVYRFWFFFFVFFFPPVPWFRHHVGLNSLQQQQTTHCPLQSTQKHQKSTARDLQLHNQIQSSP